MTRTNEPVPIIIIAIAAFAAFAAFSALGGVSISRAAETDAPKRDGLLLAVATTGLDLALSQDLEADIIRGLRFSGLQLMAEMPSEGILAACDSADAGCIRGVGRARGASY